jgi:hypothetical protein
MTAWVDFHSEPEPPGLINTPTFGIRRGVGGSHGGGEAEGAKHVSTRHTRPSSSAGTDISAGKHSYDAHTGRCERCCEGYAEQHWERIRDRLSGQKVLRSMGRCEIADAIVKKGASLGVVITPDCGRYCCKTCLPGSLKQKNRRHGRVEHREYWWVEADEEMRMYLLGWPQVRWYGWVKRQRKRWRSGEWSEEEVVWISRKR